MFNITFEALAAGAGAALRCGSSFTEMMWLWFCNTGLKYTFSKICCYNAIIFMVDTMIMLSCNDTTITLSCHDTIIMDNAIKCYNVIMVI
jgi:hypothetical protein